MNKEENSIQKKKPSAVLVLVPGSYSNNDVKKSKRLAGSNDSVS